MRFGSYLIIVVLISAVPRAAALAAEPNSSRYASDPSHWPVEERQRYLKLEFGAERATGQRLPLNRTSRASKTMIVGTSGPFAIHAGARVLQEGGTSADAALTTALAQVVVSAGAAMSYAGVLTAIHYDVSSGRVFTLDAGYNTVRGETNPMSIPRESGRAVLVPGFMAGVQALHDRFGRAPFDSLFAASIWIAEEGMQFSPMLKSWSAQAHQSITRFPEGKAIFLKADQTPHRIGDLFRQSELATTLRQIARSGSKYMYTGEWARQFVSVVRREGGAMTLEDLAAYEVRWAEPYRISYRGREVFALGKPSVSGLVTLGTLKIAETLELRKYGPGSLSADTLHYLTAALSMVNAFVRMPATERSRYYREIKPEVEAVLESEAARLLAMRIQKATARTQAPESPMTHSGGVVAVDADGNVTCIMHSINTYLWGDNGLFVGGISIPDSAALQRPSVRRAGPGGRIPDTPTPLLVLEEGRPVLASATIGSSLYPVSIQSTINFLDFGMDPESIVKQPVTHRSNRPGTVAVPADDFDERILEGLRALGYRIQELPRNRREHMWIGIRVDAKKRELKGAASFDLPSMVEGS